MNSRARVMEIIRGTPYKRPADLAAELGMHRKTILERRKELEMETERYGDTAVIEDEKTLLINMYAFLDYMKYRKELKDEKLRKYVPPYDPQIWIKACGFGRVV